MTSQELNNLKSAFAAFVSGGLEKALIASTKNGICEVALRPDGTHGKATGTIGEIVLNVFPLYEEIQNSEDWDDEDEIDPDMDDEDDDLAHARENLEAQFEAAIAMR
jgi:hypothetical protein